MAGGDGHASARPPCSELENLSPSPDGTRTANGCSLVRVEGGVLGAAAGMPAGDPNGTAQAAADAGSDLAPLVYTRKSEPDRGSEAVGRVFDPRHKYLMQAESVRLLPDQKRLSKCTRCRISTLVQVHRSGLRKSAAYRGLAICGSVWQCPLCSARISAGRAVELNEGIGRHLDEGGTVRLLTFTIPHTRQDSLSALLDTLNACRASFIRDGSVRRILDSVGMRGHVTALEVTFGQGSGWHPHLHTLLLSSDALTDSQALKLRAAWSRITARHGRPASLDHGLDIRGGDAAGSYLAKLGNEVALAVRKLGRGGDRFGIWQLLELSRQGHAWAGHAFRTYAESLKHKQQLRWSNGLKKSLGISVKSDEELAESSGEQDEALCALIESHTWKGVLRSDLRAELLLAFASGSPAEARDLLLAFGIDDSGLTVV